MDLKYYYLIFSLLNINKRIPGNHNTAETIITDININVN